MSFDTSRYIFNPRKNYNGVVMEQGRVQSDADWNDWLGEVSRRLQAGTLDTLGGAVYPPTTPYAFEISFDAGGNLTIGPGRMYVDGLLAENFGDPGTVSWDPALAEMSNTPQPPPAAETGAIAFEDQPFYTPAAPNAALPANGTYLAYLDVWTRAVDYLEDPSLIDPAIGIDTTGRLQTVWQVWLAAVGAGANCANAGNPWPAASGGLLSNAPVNSTPAGPCCLTNNTGYTGRENQHYRLEVHKPGLPGTATFVFSRDNASVETGVLAITPVTNSVLVAASQLSVMSMGRDQVLGFAPGDWIELIDNDLELAGLPGELHRIDTIDFAGKTITLDSAASVANFPVSGTGYQTDPKRCTRIRRWDQAGKIFASDGTTLITDLGSSTSTGDIPIPAAGVAIILESGITVTFTAPAGGFNTGDFWTFAARTDGSMESLNAAPPRGIHHHYVPLAVVDFSAGKVNSDCRVPWNPGGKEDCCGCCSVTVGDGIESVGEYTSINAALQALPADGGEVCILAGRYYEHVFVTGMNNVIIRGCGYQTRVASPSLAPAPPVPAPAAGTGTAAPGAAPGLSGTTTGTATVGSSSATGANADGTFNAVISIARSKHIKMFSFAVEADDGEVGILIDGTAKLIGTPSQPAGTSTPSQPTPSQPAPGQPAPSQPAPGQPGNTQLRSATTSTNELYIAPVVYDVTAKDIFLTGSTLPAIFAYRVQLLRIDENRILMKDTRSLWPSVYLSGTEMHFDRNYVGIQSPLTMNIWLPTTVEGDLSSALQVESAKSPAPSQPPAPTPAPTPLAKKTAAKKAQSTDVLLEAESSQTAVFANTTVKVAEHLGGIMIAGPSREVFICENDIVGGRFNGITLGNFSVVDGNGLETTTVVGVQTQPEDDCCNTGTLQPPSSSTTGTPGTSIVAGGVLIDIVIDRNRISNMGLCGIGPVGIFDMRRIFEVISIENLTITNNSIVNTVLRAVAALNTFGTASTEGTSGVYAAKYEEVGSPASTNTSASSFTSINSVSSGSSSPYAAICVPDVQNLVIRDNAVTNFGAQPGIGANGVFVLNGEMVDISRNQIKETRDWSANTSEAGPATVTMHGGIVIALVTPPQMPGTFTAASAYVSTIYEPGLPALRIEENVVRVALGQALVAVGLGPFAISNNHFACGGMVRGRGVPIAQTVLILNLGAAIETINAASMRSIYDQATNEGAASPYTFNSQAAASRAFMASSNGTVLFSNNICQLESRIDRQRSISSICIGARDHLIFTGNHSWIDSTLVDAFFDVLLGAGSLNVTSNRLQESPVAVYLSGFTVGVANITTQNISTFCLIVKGAPNFKIDQDNLALVNMAFPDICSRIAGK